MKERNQSMGGGSCSNDDGGGDFGAGMESSVCAGRRSAPGAFDDCELPTGRVREKH